MTKMMQGYNKMFILDELATGTSAIHRINPVIKLFVTLAYLVVVVSFGKYDVTGLIPLFLYPAVIIALGNISIRPILAGLGMAAPFIIGIGIFNPLLDREIATVIYGIQISGGSISFAALLVKCCLTVSAALLLLATTGINSISAALHKLRVPQIFIIQLLLTYRYISVLLSEASRIYHAYSLRAPRQKGISSKVWGSLLGQLLLRTYDRADRVYQAMKLRGFDRQYYGANIGKAAGTDKMYLVLWIAFFLLARFVNLPMLLGLIAIEVIK